MKFNTIHQDNRGSISLLEGEELQYPEVTVFVTRKDYARGGCIHYFSNEYLSVISGEVIYVIGEESKLLRSGESTMIPSNTPHYFISITDSVVMEWGATKEEKAKKHDPTRKIVEEINAKINNS